MLDVFIEKVVKDWQIEEGNHWISMVLRVKVGFPKEPSHDEARLYGSGTVKLVGHAVTVGVLSVANEVDGTISNDARSNPPEAQCLDTLKIIAIGGEDSNVDSQLEK